MTSYVAVDLGAESGRVVVGRFDGERVGLDVVHRFPNVPARTPDGQHWDMLRLYGDILEGIQRAVRAGETAPAGIGIDAWGVDYALLDGAGRLLGNPYHYRDSRTDGLPEAIESRAPQRDLYARTGIACLSINTIYQLLAQRQVRDPLLESARTLLMTPDLLHYWLSGQIAVERTDASTSALLGVDGLWLTDVLDRLDIPTRMLVKPEKSGTILGPVRPAVLDECGLKHLDVILPATHDTACAIVAAPFEPEPEGFSRAYISSGTWSLFGIEIHQPILTEHARLAGFTNERGADETYCFHTNIMGMWLLQECRRTWARRGLAYGYEDLVSAAALLPALDVAIDVDAPAFLHPHDMLAAIGDHLTRGGQRVVTDPAEVTRLIVEGLALRYRRALDMAERLTGTRVRAIHVLGGGAQNRLLCQLTADACQRPVWAGPVEATAMGNVLVQAMGVGAVGSLAQARAIARASTMIERYEPRG